MFTDARDIGGMPLHMSGLPPCSHLEVRNTKDGQRRYTVQIANSINGHTRLIVKNCVLQMAGVVASESGLELDEHGADQMKELLAIHLGFGPVLAQSRTEVLYSTDGMWESKTTYSSPLSLPLFAYAVALNLRMQQVDEADALRLLPTEVSSEVKVALKWMKNGGATDPDLREFDREGDLGSLLRSADALLVAHDYRRAIEELRKALFMIDDDVERSAIHNNIGYSQACLGEYAKSLISFAEALKLDPVFAYAMDNAGFAHVMLGDFVSARLYLGRAARTEGNHPGYTHRNMALLHWKQGERSVAQQHFDAAFHIDGDVDFLDFFYAQFLLEADQVDRALEHAEFACGKNEPGACELVETINARG